MSTIGDRIKTIVEGQNLHYLRTVNINDLNERVGGINLQSQDLGVYANLPDITNTAYGQTNNVLIEHTIEVYYLGISPIDATGEQTDEILDRLLPLAYQLIDKLNQDPVPPQQYIQTYSINAVETLKMTKEVLTGWQVNATVPMWRKDFDCG